MSMFEKATRMKLRFNTPVGLLGVEDLWDLSLDQLNAVAKDLNKSIKSEEEEDFLKEKSGVSTTLKLCFDIVLYILKTKLEEKEARELAQKNKERKQRLLEILERKQNASLEELSEEDLRKEIEALG